MEVQHALKQTHLVYLKHVKTILIKLLYPSGLQKLENENEEIKFKLGGNPNDQHFKHTPLIKVKYTMELIQISHRTYHDENVLYRCLFNPADTSYMLLLSMWNMANATKKVNV